jgi:hypothetical protein
MIHGRPLSQHTFAAADLRQGNPNGGVTAYPTPAEISETGGYNAKRDAFYRYRGVAAGGARTRWAGVAKARRQGVQT